jgi:GTP diphosphokinase / guanosine-3',5'-bis(diphosphate) 3'-diphosphatase
MATEVYATNEELIQDILSCFSEEDIDLVVQAWDYAESHYSTFRHPTGKPFLQYVLRVAKILVDLGSAPIVIAATIVFPPLLQYHVVFPDLEDTFSGEPELLRLVEELFALSRLEWDVWPENSGDRDERMHKEVLLKMFLLAIEELNEDDPARRLLKAVHFQKREKQVENIIRMLLASVEDIPALIIKLADRLYFMRSLKYLSDEAKKQLYCARLARISLAVYAPLADRLGLWRLKSELEDMSFRLLDFNTYRTIADQLAAKKGQRERAVNDIIPLIQVALEEYGIDANISGRAKHIYSIYKKMQAKQLTLEQINDLMGIRIIVDVPEERGGAQKADSEAQGVSYDAQKAKKKAQEAIQSCYDVQDIILDKWPPIRTFYDGEVGRDWIANPKENGYQSLHTTVKINGKIVEIQIRTRQMHETAEYGAAAEHWRYKDPKIYRKGKTPRVTKEKDVIWGEQLVELRKSMSNQQESVDLMQKGLLKDRIYVITPQGHVLDFPKGSTPLDFAYRIHTDLGHRYTGAKVDGHIVRLDYHLNNGAIVELIASRPRPGPNPDWLDKSKDEEGKSTYIFARMAQTRSKIRRKLEENDPLKPKPHK